MLVYKLLSPYCISEPARAFTLYLCEPHTQAVQLMQCHQQSEWGWLFAARCLTRVVLKVQRIHLDL